MVEIFTPAVNILLLALGIPIGFGAHALYIKHYLKKNMHKHPEFKMFLELLEKNKEG